MTEREAFEAWVDQRGDGLKLRWIGQDGSVPVPVGYPEHGNMTGLVRGAWEGWQASAARYEAVVEALEDSRNCCSACPTCRARAAQALAALDGAE